MSLFNRLALLLPLAGASSAAMADAAQSHGEGFLDASTWSVLNRSVLDQRDYRHGSRNSSARNAFAAPRTQRPGRRMGLRPDG